MKRRRLFLIAMAMFVVSCQHDFTQPSIIEQCEVIEQTDNSHSVTADDAIAYATSFISGDDSTRSAERIVKSCELYVAQPTTRNSESPEVSFYLINYENNQGYALVSTDDRTTPVYLYGEEGNLSISDIESHSGISLFMESAIPNYIAEIEQNSAGLSADVTITLPGTDNGLIPPDLLLLPTVCIDGVYYFCKTTTEDVDTEPLVHAYWHQREPYNKYASPFTGCGINAVGQIMSYYEHPSSYDGYVYDWSLMKQHSMYYTECAASNMIAWLMYQMGDYLGVEYESSGTWTYPSQSRQLFLEFGYTCSQVTDYTPYTSYLITKELDAQRPIWIRGEDANDGHAWVIDAYRRTNTKKEYYQNVSPYSLCFTRTSSTPTYYRCIWGQSGNVIPYYYLKTEFYYPNNLKFIYNIQPNSN